jgi:exonuclease SbcC
MVIHELKMRGFKGLAGYPKGEVEINFSAFGDGLIALVGANGAGKTTILEACHPYRELVSRSGSLTNHTFLKDSYRDLTFEFQGKTYRSLFLIDGESGSGKVEAYLYEDGTPLNDGKCPSYDELVRKLFGPPEIFFGSVFTSQNCEKLSELPKGKRKEFFVALLGLEHLQRYSDLAKARAERIHDSWLMLDTEIGTIDRRLEELKDSPRKLEALKAQISSAEEKVKAARAEMDSAAEEKAQLEKAIADQRVLRERVKGLEESLQSLSAKDKELKQEWGEEIRSFHLQKDEISRAMQEAGKLLDRKSEIESTLAKLKALRLKREELVPLARERDRLQEKVSSLRREIDLRKEANREKLNNLQGTVALLEKTTGCLDTVPCRPDARPELETEVYKTCPLLASAFENQRDLATRKEELQELEKSVAVVQAGDDLTAVLEELAQLPAEVDELPNVESQIRKLEVGEWEDQAKELSRAEIILEENEKAKAALEERRQGLDHKYEQALTTVSAEREAKKKELGALISQLDPSLPEKLTRATEQFRDAEGRMESARTEKSRLEREQAVVEREIEEARKLETAKSEAEKERSSLEREISEWRFLQRACGKDGIQALELDAAGPGVSEIATQILQKFGKDWYLQLVTQQEKADRSGKKEVFDIVITSADGVKRYDDLSGGEKVWVEESLRKAVAIFLFQRSGSASRFQTLFQDEVDGALDPERAQAFLETTREAHRLTGAHHTILVSQRPDFHEQIDQRIILSPGEGVTLVY